jgi:hypothetical protein
MNFKEHIQFLVMMIPTLLLLIAAAISLAVPGAPYASEPAVVEYAVMVDTEAGPQHAAAVR